MLKKIVFLFSVIFLLTPLFFSFAQQQDPNILIEETPVLNTPTTNPQPTSDPNAPFQEILENTPVLITPIANPQPTSNPNNPNTQVTSASNPSSPTASNDLFPNGLVPCTGVTGSNPCDFKDLMELVRRVISMLIYITVLISVCGIAYAGFLYLTSAGDTGKVSRAHGIFLGMALGLALALGAWLLVNAIAGTLKVNIGSFWYLGPLKP